MYNHYYTLHISLLEVSSCIKWLFQSKKAFSLGFIPNEVGYHGKLIWRSSACKILPIARRLYFDPFLGIIYLTRTKTFISSQPWRQIIMLGLHGINKKVHHDCLWHESLDDLDGESLRSGTEILRRRGTSKTRSWTFNDRNWKNYTIALKR